MSQKDGSSFDVLQVIGNCCSLKVRDAQKRRDSITAFSATVMAKGNIRRMLHLLQI